MGDVYTNPPQSRNEAILRATIDGTEYTAPPQSRIEDLLLELKEAIEEGGGTGEGDMKKSVYDADRAVQNAGGIKPFVNGAIGTLPQRVGTVEGKVSTLEGQMLSVEDDLDSLGTASTKNSTSVVTESSDLVESGAVYTELQGKADNTVIGTVEDGANPTKSYAVGEHFIRNGKFCTVTVAVTTSSTWTLGSNYVEGTIADNLVKQNTFSGTTSDIGAVVIYNSNDRVILSAETVGYTTSLYKRSAGYGCVIRTPQGEALINTAVSLTYYYI